MNIFKETLKHLFVVVYSDMYMHGVCMCTDYMCMNRDRELVLSMWLPETELRLSIRLGKKHLYPLSHLTGPKKNF